MNNIDPKKSKEPNIITLTEKELQDANNNPSEVSNPEGFMSFSSNKSQGGIGDLIGQGRVNLKPFVEDSREGIDLSKYKEYLNPTKAGAYAFPFEADIDKARALGQSGVEQAGRTALKLIPKIGLEFVGMLGNTLDVEDYINAESNGEVGNWLNNWAQEQKANLDEWKPTYRENPGEALDIGDSAWWFESGSSLVESATAFVGLGYVTGAGALKALTSGGKALEFLGAIGKGVRATDTAKKGTQVAAGLTNTLMLNQAEGIGIATNVYNDTFAEEFDKLTAEGLSKEEATQKAKMIASEDAASVINFNRANMFLNVSSSFAFLKSPALTRELLKNPSIRISAKNTFKEGIQETGEELVNLVAEKQAGNDMYDIETAFDDIATKEGLESGILGFIGGAGQTMLTNAGRELRLNKNNQGKRTSRNDTQRERYSKQQEAISKWDNLAKEEKLTKGTDAYFKAKESFLLYSELQILGQEYKDTKDPQTLEKIQDLKSTLLFNQAYDAFSTGTTEQLINVFEGISNISKEEAKAKGLDENTYVEDSKKAIEKIERLEKEYNKASSYLNSNDVYSNRAVNTFLKEEKEEVDSSLKEIEGEVYSDLESLGITLEDIEVNENNIINIKNHSKLPENIKEAIKGLESYNLYKNLNKKANKVKKDIKNNTLEYTNLISSETQKNIKKDIRAYKNKKKNDETNNTVQENQSSNIDNKNETTQRFEETEEIEIPAEPVNVENAPTFEGEKYFDYGDFGDASINAIVSKLETKDNETYNDSSLPLKNKLNYFTNKLAQSKNTPEELRNKLTLQYKKVIKELEEKIAVEDNKESVTANKKEAANNNIQELASLMEEDKSPKKAQNNTDKITAKIVLLNEALDNLEDTDVNIQSFKDVALYASEVLGSERFQELFTDFRAVYNLTRRGPASDLRYVDVFYSKEDKESIVKDSKNTNIEVLLNDFYNLSDLEYRVKVEEDLKNYIEKQDYKVLSSDTAKIEGLRIIEGFNKIAYLAKEYSSNVVSKKTRKFNILDFEIRKEDLNNELNSNVDEDLLDYSIIKEGTEIEFRVLDKVVFSDGTIVYKNGDTEIDGVITKGEPRDIAPIAIVANNKLLKGAFLHTTEWINNNNIADKTDVARQKAQLLKIREAVLNAENQRISTTIKLREDGKLMFSPEGKLKTTKENLPNAKIAIGKDQLLYTSKNKGESLNNSKPPYLLNGGVYAVFPVNNDADYATLLQPVNLKDNETYKKSILKAVELYLKQDTKDARVLELFNQTGIDITKIKGLQTYLNKFLYLNNNIKYSFGDFTNFVKGVKEDVGVIRIVEDRLEFGIGKGVGGTISSVSIQKLKEDNNSQDSIIGLLHKLEKVLDISRLNIKKDFLGKDFELPIITSNDVKTEKVKYNDFVKENTLTSQYSITLKNGKEIYTVQSNLQFNTGFLNEKVVSKEVENEAIDNRVEVKNTPEVKFGNTTLKVTDFDVDDLSPKQLSKQQEQNIEESTPSPLSIQGLSLNVQNTIINSIIGNIVNDAVDSNYKDTAIDYITKFENELTNVYIDAYQTRADNATDENERYSDLKRVELLTKIKDAYPTIKNIIYNKLLTFNHLKVNKDKIELLKNNKEIVEDLGLLESEFTANEEESKDDTASWSDYGVFMEDFRDKMGIELRNYLGSIEDVESFNYDSKGDRTANTKYSPLLNLIVPVPLDTVINEVASILSFDGYNYVEPNFDKMMQELDKWVEVKPFLHNVIEKLNKADDTIKNRFVSVMNKHNTNHVFLFKKDGNNLYLTKSDRKSIVRNVHNSWYNNIINSKLIRIENSNYIIDKNIVNEINDKVKTLISNIKDKKFNPEEAKEVLDLMGLGLSLDTINSIQSKGIKYSKTPYSILQLFINSDGAFKIYLDNLNNAKESNIENVELFSKDDAIIKFTKVLTSLEPQYFSSSFRDVKGNLYHSYSPNKFLTDRVKDLKFDSNLIERLKNQAFTKNSLWLNQVIEDKELFDKVFNYYTIDGLSIKDGANKKISDLTEGEYEEFKINLFFSNVNTDKNNYIINTFYPTTSDKTVQYGLTNIGRKWSDSFIPGTKRMSDKAVDDLYKLIVEPEVDRILQVQKNPDLQNIKGYKEGGMLFNLIPELNNIKELREENFELKVNIKTNPTLQTAIKTELRKFVGKLTNDKIKKWKQYGFVDSKTEQIVEGTKVYDRTTNLLSYTKRPLVDEALDYTINYLVSNVNVYQLFTTDPAFYWKSSHWKTVAKRSYKELGFESIKELENDLDSQNSSISRNDVLKYYSPVEEKNGELYDDFVVEHEDLFNNLGKRLGGDVGPGIDYNNANEDTFKIGVLKDNVKESYLVEYYKGLKAQGAEDYLKVNSTDAQELTLLKEHLYGMFKEGKITKAEMTSLLDKDNMFIPFTDEELELIYQPVKPLLVTNIWNNGVEHRVYIKSSSFPLSKQLTKGLEIDKLRKAMVNQGYDRVAFESAVKVGGVINPTKVYKDNKGNVEDKIDIQGLNNGEPISRAGFKIQQEVPYKTKLEINDGSQQRKLLTSLIRKLKGFKVKGKDKTYTGQEVQDRIDEIYHDIYKDQFTSLVEELGFDIQNNTITNIKALEKILKEEALTREYSLYDLEALNVVDGDFEIPLWATGVSSKIESMLNSIIDNRIRKIKVKGQSYVLGTSEGFKPTVIEGEEATEYVKNNTNIIFDKEWVNSSGGVLRPMRIENGEVKPAEVMVSPKLKDSKGNWISITDYTTKEGFLDMDKINPEVLELFGFRIPTQNLNSMSYIKIVGFLPEKSGDLILAPSEWTVQMGSDFDVDKLYANLYHIDITDTGYLDLYIGDNKRYNLENELLSLHKSVLMHKDVQKEIVRPLSFGKLPSLAKEIYKYTKDQTDGRGISEEYQSYKYHNGKAGKTGTGVFSVDSVFNTSLQGTDIYLRKFVKNEAGKTEEREVVFKLGGKTSNKLSNPETNNGSVKAMIIEAFQSLSVDNENEQGLHKLNINSDTFDAIKTLIFSGFEEDVITYFINQPIIRRLIELQQLEKDSITEFSRKDLNNTLLEEFPITDREGMKSGVYDNISMKVLKEGIENTTSDSNFQNKILSLFNELTEYGLAIKNLQSTINTERSGVGKNLLYTAEKEKQVLELPEKRNFANVERLIGEYITIKESQGADFIKVSDNNAVNILAEEWYNSPDTKRKGEIVEELLAMDYYPVTTIKNGNRYNNTLTFIRPDNISGFGSTYALLTNNKLWGNFYPYTNKKIQSLFKELNNKENDSLSLKAANNKKVFDNIKSFLIAKAVSTITEGDLLTERNRLMIDVEGKNVSLANIINTLKEKGKINNPFINRLELQIKKVVLPSTIKYGANLAESIDERAIYASIVDMLKSKKVLGTFNGIEYTNQVLMQDLITYSYINGGVQGAENFVKYIPLNYLKELGFYKDIKDTNLYNEDDFNSDNFRNQHLQHNANEVKLGETTETWIDGKQYKYLNNKTVVRRLDSGENYLPTNFSVYDKTLKKLRLYHYETDAKQWVEKDTLGNKDIKEFDNTKEWNISIIKQNKVIIPTTINVPVNAKETKETLKLTDNLIKPAKIIYDNSNVSIEKEYQLDNNDMTSIDKMGYILNTIITNNTEPLNTIFAKELLKNIDKISEYNFIIDTTINAEEIHSYKNKTIKVNTNETKTKQEFEDAFLEGIIHAFTKYGIVTNASNEVLKVKALREEAEAKVREHLGKSADIRINAVKRKLETGAALTIDEYDIIYPIINAEEFVGRLFKSKRLQKILNNSSEVLDEKGFLAKILDFIRSIFVSNNIDIQKGSTLEYALANSLLLIKQKAPISSITGELKNTKPVYRTPDFIYNRFNLLDEKGNIKKVDNKNAEKIVKWISENTTNLVAVNNKGIIDIKNNTQLDLFADDLSAKKESNASNLKKSLDDRIRNLKDNIEKATAREDFAKVAQLQEELKGVKESKQKAITYELLSDIVTIGRQDMDQLEEMFNNKVSLEDTLYIRKVIHYWENAVDTLFDEDDRKSEDLVNAYKEVETKALIFKDRLVKIENNYMEELLAEHGNMTTVEDIFYHFKDINGLQALTMDISRSNNALLDAAFLLVKNANIDALDEKRTLLNKLSSLEEKVKQVLKNKGNNKEELYELFRQKTKNKKLTGHLVSRYSVEFIKDIRRLSNNIYKDATYNNHEKFLDWFKENSKDINLKYLFPNEILDEEDTKKAKEYKEKLKKELGVNEYNELIREQTILLEDYENHRKGYLEYAMNKFDVSSVKELFDIQEAYNNYLIWLRLNSPYQFYNQTKAGVPVEFENFEGYNSSKYVKFIPNNNSSYDANFKSIENDSTLFEFYNYFNDLDAKLKSYLSTEDKAKLAMEGIPYVDKMLLEQYKDKGMKAGLAPIWDGIKDSIRVNEDGIIDDSIKDPVTGEDRRLSVNLSANNGKTIQDYINKKAIEYKLKNSKDASDKLILQWKEDIIDQLSQNKSYDLAKVLRVYTMTALGYKHKAKIEDSLKLIQNIFNEQQEFERNSRGVIKTDKGNNPRVKDADDSFKNTKVQLDYFMQVLYGKKRENEGVGKNKIYTSGELTDKKEIENILKDLDVRLTSNQISKDDYESMKTALEEMKSNLGGVAVNSKIGDALLKFVQLKGMGWNILSSVANLGFGYISNRLEAVGGQLYNKKQLTKAYGMVRESMLKNATFNQKETQTAKKIRSLMDRFDVLNTSVNELYSSPLGVELGKNLKWASTYNIVERAEYVNQAPIMIALMLNSKITVGDKEIDLWEGFDNNGEWKSEYGEYPRKEINKLRIKIDQNNKMNHGNYDPDSPIAGKNKFLGRALLQFRSWMLEGIAVRFEKEKPDAPLGIIRKGRYVSFVDFYKNAGFMQGSLDILKGFVRSATGEVLFKNSNFENYSEEGLKEVDIANMRKVMAEMVMLLGLHTTYLLLSMTAEGLDDEEDSFKVYVINNLINQGLRLKTDITFYLNPSELKKLIKDPVPVLSIITDTLGFMDASYKFIQGKDEIKSGVYSGHSRLLRETSQMLPLSTQFYKSMNYGIQVFDK